jgi:hypothetical protein
MSRGAAAASTTVASTFTNLLFHIVYSTKYRRSCIHADRQERLYQYIGGSLLGYLGLAPEALRFHRSAAEELVPG